MLSRDYEHVLLSIYPRYKIGHFINAIGINQRITNDDYISAVVRRYRIKMGNDTNSVTLVVSLFVRKNG